MPDIFDVDATLVAAERPAERDRPVNVSGEAVDNNAVIVQPSEPRQRRPTKGAIASLRSVEASAAIEQQQEVEVSRIGLQARQSTDRFN